MIRNFKSSTRTFGRWAAVIALPLVFVTSALAQDERSQVTLQGTGVFIKDTDNNGLTQEATRSAGFLVGYSYKFHRWAGVEGNYGWARNTQKYFAGAGPTSIQSNIHEITGAFVLHVPLETPIVKPYALAGAGALVFDPTDSGRLTGADQQTKATFVYGGGLNFDVVRHFGIRAEYRGFVYKTPDFKLGILDLDKVTHLAQPSLGVFFRF